MHDGDPVPDRGVVDEVAGGEVVGAVDDHVPALAEDALDVLGGEPLLVGLDVDVRVERLDRPLRRVDLRLAEAVGRVDDLALEVRVVDHVRVDDPERPDAGRGEVERGGGAEPTGADQQHAGAEQPLLARLADLGDQQVARVAAPLVGRERVGRLDGEAVALPVGEAAGERDDVLVAQVGERLRGERRAGAAGAVDDELTVAIGDEPFDPRLELAAGNVHGTRDGALLPFVALAHVDEEGGVLTLARLGRADLVDLGLHLRKQLSIGRHLSLKRYGRSDSSRYPRRVTPRLRTFGAVGAIALLAAAAVTGAAVLSAEEVESAPASAAQPQPRQGFPRLQLSLGVRDDAEARDLRRAAELYEAGKPHEAGHIFGRYDSLEAKLGAAFAAWPASEDRIEQLGALYPRSALVQLHVGLARFWAGTGGADTAWREARDVEPDTPYAVRAGDLLHARILRPACPSSARAFRTGSRARRRRQQLETLRADASARGRLLYGVALQRLGRPVSARRAFAQALRLAPDDVDALVADAVGRYEKSNPSAAFSRLGPLTRRFPKAATIRFHLGVLLLWQGDVAEAKRQLRLARAAEPGSRIAREARRYLDEVAKAGTG